MFAPRVAALWLLLASLLSGTPAESDADSSLRIARVGADGAARAGGLAVGDRIVGWDGATAPLSLAAWREVRLEHDNIRPLTLQVADFDGTRSVTLSDGAWDLLVVACADDPDDCAEEELQHLRQSVEARAPGFQSDAWVLAATRALDADLALELADSLDAAPTTLAEVRLHAAIARALFRSDAARAHTLMDAARAAAARVAPGSGWQRALDAATARILVDLGRREEAVQLLTDATSECEADIQVDCAIALSYLGVAAAFARDLATGETACQRAVAALDAHRPHSQALAIAHNCRYITALFGGRLLEAERHLSAGLEALTRDHATSGLAMSLRANRAFILSWRGEHRAAFDEAFFALTEHQRIDAPDATIGRDLSMLAMFARRMGRFEDAARYLERAMALSPEPPANLLLTRADIAYEMEDREAALEALASIGETSDAMMTQRAANLRGLLAERDGDHQGALAFYLRSATLAEETQPGTIVLANAEHRVGKALHRLGRTEEAVDRLASSVTALEAQLANFGGTGITRAEYRHAFQGIYKDYIERLVELGRHDDAISASRRYRAQELSRLVLGEGLGDRRVAERAPSLAPGQAIYSLIVGEQRTIGFLLHRPTDGATERRTVRVIDLPRAILRERLAAWLEALETASADQSGEVALASALFEQLFGDLPLDDIGRLTVLPDDALWQVPFAALVTSQRPTCGGRACRLVDNFIIDQTLAEASAGSSSSASLRNALVLVGPQLQEATDRSGAGEPDLDRPPLAGALEEAEVVEALWADEATVRVGTQAVEASFFRDGPAADLIHLAGHSVVSADLALSSYFQLTPDAASDGRLTAREILAQGKLDGGLVVLAGCDSGGGAAAGGEGILGLRYALHASGATHVLATHWRIEDRSSARLMGGFYRELRARQDPARALAVAQRQAADAGVPVATWAAFSLSRWSFPSTGTAAVMDRR